MRSPAFQFYVRDWILSRSIQKMSGEEVKAYIYLLSEAWLEEPRATLPNDEEQLARMAQVSSEKWNRVKARVMANFTLDGERWVNSKLQGVSKNQEQFKKWGKMGGNPKIVKNHEFEPKEVNPIVNHEVNGKDIPLVNLATSTATAIDTSTAIKTKNICTKPLEGFNEFWDLYPRRMAKGSAVKAWYKLNPSLELKEKILQSVKAQLQGEAWTKDDGKWIPFPATWLNGSRWEDENFDSARPKVETEEEYKKRYSFDQWKPKTNEA